jgi:hypothetical protein
MGLKSKSTGFAERIYDCRNEKCGEERNVESGLGRSQTIRNQFKELAVTLQQIAPVEPTPAAAASTDAAKMTRKITIRFRSTTTVWAFVTNFRTKRIEIFYRRAGKIEFNLTGDHKTFWIPGDYDSNEYTYNTSKLSEMTRQSAKMPLKSRSARPFADNAVQTPLMMKSNDGLYLISTKPRSSITRRCI